MVRIALSSDNHFDVNRVDPQSVISQQATYLHERHVDYYLIAGDLFNDFQKSLRYVEDLQKTLGQQTRVFFIAGNHDMVHGVSFEELENSQFPGYLHNQSFQIPGSNWQIIGNNGWYDYHYADFLKRPAKAFAQWKRAFWIDGTIKQPITDEQRMNLVLSQTEALLVKAQQQQQHVVFFTHFVPRVDYLRFTQDNRFWNMAMALMGSPRMGELLEKYQTEHVLFGHLHAHPVPRKFGATWYYDQAVGYNNRRIHEWRTNDFMNEWLLETQVLDLPNQSPFSKKMEK